MNKAPYPDHLTLFAAPNRFNILYSIVLFTPDIFPSSIQCVDWSADTCPFRMLMNGTWRRRVFVPTPLASVRATNESTAFDLL